MFVNQPEHPGAAVRRVPVPGLGDPAAEAGAAPRRRCARSSRPPTRSPVVGAAAGGARPTTSIPLLDRGPPVKILHTSDWHVGKVLKGQARLDEHIAVLGRDRRDRPRPSGPTWSSSPATCTTPRRRRPDATKLVTRALSRAARAPARRWSRSAATTTTAPALDALRPWAEAAGITLRGTVRDQPDRARDHRRDRRRRGGGGWSRCRSCPSATPSAPPRCSSSPPPRRRQTYADHMARLLAAR